jgi:hypothetical protein
VLRLRLPSAIHRRSIGDPSVPRIVEMSVNANRDVHPFCISYPSAMRVPLLSILTASVSIPLLQARDWPAFMAQNDLIWENGISPDFYNGAFIGDGVQGAMILRDGRDKKAVRMLLGHYSAITYSTIPKWEYCQSRVFAGNIVITPTTP